VTGLHIRHFDFASDAVPVLGFMPELYESNFSDFRADADFLARKRAQLREASRDPGQAVLVSVDERGISGFIWLVIEVEYSGRRRGEVAAIHVDKRCRGTGVGRALMDEGMALLRTYGCEAVHLMVTTTNETAVGLYKHLGFSVTRYQMEKPLR